MYGASENSGASSALGPIKNSPGQPINEETQVRPFTDRAKSVPAASHILIEAKLAHVSRNAEAKKGLAPLRRGFCFFGHLHQAFFPETKILTTHRGR
jgi:hypothetical protein